METEYKYRLADDANFEEMLQVDRLAAVSLGPVRRILVNDRYLDTPDGALLRAGYSCRLRESHNGDRKITVKSLTESSGGLHRREEYETVLVTDTPVHEVRAWPVSVVRDLLIDLVHEDRLEELFTFGQERFQRDLPDGALPQVELSFDRVTLGGRQTRMMYWLEAELLDDGSAELLDQVVSEMRQIWNLHPESRAKFWWALVAMRPDLVTEEE